MKNINKFDAYDEVVVEGKEGIFTVEAYFESMYIGNGKSTYELWYTIRDKKFGGIYEVRHDLVSSAAQRKKEIMDETLDKYNENLELERLTWDSQYGEKAKYILGKMKLEYRP